MSDSPSRTSMGSHEVFISHRGVEMKKGFANYLYHALKIRGISSFLDMEELPKGEDVRKRMLEAAKSAPIAVPIFTQIYGSSHWCLEELVEMIESKRKVIPVFFDVRPEDLRMENGEFAKHFEGHLLECGPSHNEEKIEQWKHALREASWLDGFWLEKHGGRQGELVEAIVAKISNEIVHRLPVDVRREAVPLDVKVKNVVERFRLNENRTVNIVLLWGMGGIGKTTLARAIFDSQRTLFEEATFVENCGDQKGSQIQYHLCKHLLREERDMEGDSARGREFLQSRLRHKKVLMVLDDMKSEVEEIIDPKKLCPGSRILVTSRNQRVFRQETDFSGVFKAETYELQPMDERESSQLFCHHAFNKPSANPGFEELVKNVVKACHGLPLSLEVLGRHLRGMKTKKQWEEAIIKLRNNRYDGISGRLKISYDALDKEEQQMFLDVACFFIGEYEFRTKCYWNCLGYCCETGLERLIKLCLVKVSEDKRLTMHDHLRDLGRDLSRSTRLGNDENLKQLLHNEQGLGQIRGLATSQPCLDASLLSKMRSLQILLLGGTSSKNICKGLRFPKIRWLKLENCRCWGPFLRQLPLQFLTVLQIFQQGIAKLPSSFRKLKRLRVLDISGCRSLEALPKGFGSLPSLEELWASGLISLTELPCFLGELKSLRVLDIRDCTMLKALPEGFGSLESLEELWASELFSLTELPSSFGQLKKLRLLDICYCTKLKALPQGFGLLESLEELRADGLESLTELPSSFGRLERLRVLDISSCDKLEALPEGFGSLGSLEELRASRLESITELPSSFSQLKRLRVLDIGYCTKLETLPEGFGSLESLEELRTFGLRSLTELPSSFRQLKRLRSLDIRYCTKLEVLPEDFGSLERLEELRADKLYTLTGVSSQSSLLSLERLEELRVDELDSLTGVSSQSSLLSLERLEESRADELDNLTGGSSQSSLLSSSSSSNRLRCAAIISCSKLEALS